MNGKGTTRVGILCYLEVGNNNRGDGGEEELTWNQYLTYGEPVTVVVYEISRSVEQFHGGHQDTQMSWTPGPKGNGGLEGTGTKDGSR